MGARSGSAPRSFGRRAVHVQARQRAPAIWSSALDQIARSIHKRFPGRPIEVDRHTDAKGSVAYNDRLSPRRARAVARWLVDHGGLPRSRMTVRGFGERDPVAPNTEPEGSDNPAGRRLNRRVVVGVTR